MGKLVVSISMSVDGFIAGPNASPENPLGDHGPKLHDWYFKHKDANNEIAKTLQHDLGAIIIGRRMYDESLPWWGGSGPAGGKPCFVLTEKGTEPESAAPMFTFVTEGIEKALELAKSVAKNKNVAIGGGAKTIQEYLKANLVEELAINIVPIFLGGGTSLFDTLGKYVELEKVQVIDEPDVTQLTYRLTTTGTNKEQAA